MTPTDRRAGIVDFLRTQVDFVSTRQIASRFDVAISTIERDLAALRNVGTPLVTQPGRTGGVALELDANGGRTPNIGESTAGKFVGRGRELNLLNEVFGANDTTGSIALIAGGSGVGKSRLVQEFQNLHESSESKWYWNRSLENFRTPPLWPWVSIIESIVADLSEEIAEQGQHLIDELSAPTDARQGEEALAENVIRFKLFNRMSKFIFRLPAKQSVIVLDDLQWADASSLAFLEFLSSAIRGTQLTVICIYDSTMVTRQSALGRVLGGLSRSDNLSRISLRPLQEVDALQMVDMESGSTITAELRRRIFERSEGSPFFIKEMVRWVAETRANNDREVTTEHLLHSIPEGILDALGRRLNLLSDECIRLLGYASVIGREFRYYELIYMVGQSGIVDETSVPEVLDEAVAAAVLIHDRESGQYRFSHTLVYQAINDQISVGERSGIHGLAGQALERGDLAEINARSEDLARHFMAAAPAVGYERAVHYSMQAGTQALQRFAYEDAATHFQNVLDIKWDGLDELSRFEAIGRFGQASVAYLPRADKHQAVSTLIKAVDYFVSIEQLDRAVEFALTDISSVSTIDRSIVGTDICGLIELVIHRVPDGSNLQAQLLTRYAAALVTERRELGEAQTAAELALKISAPHDAPQITLRANRALLAVNFRDSTDRDVIADRARSLIRDAIRIGDIETELRGHWYLCVTLMAHGSQVEARSAGDQFLQRAEVYKETGNLQQALGFNAHLAVRFGDWDHVKELTDSCERRFGSSGWVDMPLRAADVYNGDSDATQRLVDFVLDDQFDDEFLRLVSVVALICNRPDLVSKAMLEAMNTLVDEIVTTSLNAHELLVVEIARGLLASYAPDGRETAAGLYEKLAEPAIPILLGIGIHPHRIRAKLAIALGDANAGLDHLSQAIDFYETNECDPELAMSLFDLSKLCVEMRKPTDEIVGYLDSSVTLASNLGMSNLIERVNVLRAQTEAEPEMAAANPKGLSDREVEVLLLISTGNTNRGIGEQLFISENTVTRHITNIYSKIGAINRSEATAFALNINLSTR